MKVIPNNDLYGGTYRIFTKVFANYGIKFTFSPFATAQEIESLVTPNTKLVWLETPTNPMLNVLDIKLISGVCKKHNLLLAVDNTFATPYLQNPINFGADMVVHSLTKYIAR